VFTVISRVTFLREEADSDYHLILQQRVHHDRRGSRLVLRPSRKAALPPRDGKRPTQSEIVRTSTADRRRFFDYDHGQEGVASNAIELHPILHFRCLHS
jgi:hypothetical protein